MDITRDAIIAAYRQTEILPVARTWDTRASLPDGRSVACGCALVALCRAAGIDPEPIIDGTGLPSWPRGLLEYRLARALGLSEAAGSGVVNGWDRWPSAPDYPPNGNPTERAAYLAAWEAAAAVLGGASHSGPGAGISDERSQA